ncbi:tetratricopeptide repeat protein [Pararhizobium arenae]|uniref:tetratricopeptide repeat protein n=1 Tax=Pararhizobium arenae TaxID=1856850 RepID=UPI0009FA33CA|nr:tetratricopeptide repeat protein [Pararhizobium arenae]
MRKTIERIRQVALAGEENPLTFDTEHVHLNAKALTSDIDHFDRDGDNPLERFVNLETFIGRVFLEGFDIPSSLAAWLKRQRHFFALQLRDSVLEAWPTQMDASHRRLAKHAALTLTETFPEDEQLQEILHGNLLPKNSQRLTAPAYPTEVPQRASAIKPDAIQSPFANLPRLVLMPPRGTHTDIASALIEDITIELCALRHVSVVAPYTAERIRNDPDKASLLANHSISYWVDTSFCDDSLFAQMVFAPTDSVIWAERFVIGGDSVVSERNAITRLITGAISEQLKIHEKSFVDYKAHPEAYRGYLAGSRHLNRLGLPEVRRARSAFRKTLIDHSTFAPAASGMARTYWMEWVMTARGDINLLDRARQAAMQAIDHNPDLASGYRELGVTELYLGNVEASLEALEHAVGLSPHYADAIYSQADSLVHASRPEEGLVKIRRAIELNPLCPDDYYWAAAGASFLSAQFQDAIAFTDRMSDHSSVHRLLAASWAMMGNGRKARSHRKKALELNPQFDVEKWLAVVPLKDRAHRELYREGLLKAGF